MAEVRRGEGLSRLFARAAVVLRGAVYRTTVVVSLDLSRPPPRHSTDVPIELRLLLPEDLQAYARLRDEPAGSMPGSGRLGRGDVCVAAWLDGEIVAIVWIAFENGRLDEVGREVRLAPDEVYLYDSYTAERVRERGVASARALWTAAYLREAGYRRAIGWISPQNRPAFGPARKAGYEIVGTVGFIRVGPLRWDFVQPVGARRRSSRRDQPIEVERDFRPDSTGAIAPDSGKNLESPSS